MSRIAIVILNYNGQQHLETFLPSVLEHCPAYAEIMVADNGSTDDSVTYLKKHFPSVSIILLDKNYGFAEGYNQALQEINSDYFLLLNSDVKVTAGWLDPLFQLMESDGAVAAVQPKVLAYERPAYFEHAGAAGGLTDYLGFTFCVGRIFEEVEKDQGQYDQVREITWASGAAMLIRGELFREFGGFDGDYFAHMEEIDLCWRMRNAGYKIMAHPSSTVYHLGGGTLDYQHPRKTFLNFRNTYATLFKNLTISRLLWLIPFRLAIDAGAGLLFLKNKRLDLFWALVRAHWAFFSKIPNLIKKRKANHRRIQRLKIGPRNEASIFPRSIVWAYYLKGIKTFKALKNE